MVVLNSSRQSFSGTIVLTSARRKCRLRRAVKQARLPCPFLRVAGVRWQRCRPMSSSSDASDVACETQMSVPESHRAPLQTALASELSSALRAAAYLDVTCETQPRVLANLAPKTGGRSSKTESALDCRPPCSACHCGPCACLRSPQDHTTRWLTRSDLMARPCPLPTSLEWKQTRRHR